MAASGQFGRPQPGPIIPRGDDRDFEHQFRPIGSAAASASQVFLRRVTMSCFGAREGVAGRLFVLRVPLSRALHIVAVACGAGRRCWLVEEDFLSFDLAEIDVTIAARDILVGALQREGSLLMIEQRWLPFGAVVAVAAWSLLVGTGELAAMHVFMAVFALCWRGLERNMQHRLFHIRRLVAVNAGYRAMRTHQREVGLRMIEGGHVLPSLRGVACFAACRLARRIQLGDAVREFAFVNVLMASYATQVIEVIRHSLAVRHGLVAVNAGHRQMAPGECEGYLLVLRDGKRGRLEAGFRVALLAAVEVRRLGKLPLVDIFMAVRTECKFYLIDGISTRRDMAFCALQLCMFFTEWEARAVMVRILISRRFEAINNVTSLAAPSILAFRKLSVVRVLMAVGAILKCDDRLEVSGLVAGLARYLAVFAEQGILGLGVIEVANERDLQPARGVVTRFARAVPEIALVRIAMAVVAASEFNPDVTRLPVRPWLMAALARYFLMGACQRILRLGMVKLRGLLPVCSVVALQAIASQLAFVFIFVATGAGLG